MDNEMYDLIYMENHGDYIAASDDLKERFQPCVIEDASDFIHRNRFSVKIDSINRDDYLIRLLNAGLALHSLFFQCAMMEKPSEISTLVKQWKESTCQDAT